MMEKYAYPSRRDKFARYTSALTESQMGELDSIREQFHVQLPDLLVFKSNQQSFSFAEVKGDRDRLSPKQVESHAAIRRRLGVEVEIINVKPTPTDWNDSGN